MIILRRQREVMSQFGTGGDDFTLSASNGERAGERCRNFGFNGPIMVEGVKAGATTEETTAILEGTRPAFDKRDDKYIP